MTNLFAINANNWFALRPIFVGTIPAGEYRSEILHVESHEDESPAYMTCCYRFSSDDGTYDLSVRYYDGSRWWRDFSSTLAGYGFSSIDEIVGLHEIVTIAEPTNGGRYMEIMARRRAEEKPKKGASFVKGPRSRSGYALSRNKVEEETVDDDVEENLDEDFLNEDED